VRSSRTLHAGRANGIRLRRKEARDFAP